MKTWIQLTNKQKIRRWKQGLQVLKKLTKHQREHHFKMDSFGVKTPCGTVACIAGHFGLSEVFRKQGFRMTFRRGETDGNFYNDGKEVYDPDEFFENKDSGLVRSRYASGLFYDFTIRSVEGAEDRIRKIIKRMEAIDARGGKIP